MSTSGAGSIGIALTGATGRMGRALIEAVNDDSGTHLAGATVRGGSEFIGIDAGSLAGCGALGVPIGCDLADYQFDCLIDFSLVEPSLAAIDACVARGLPVVVGTTGFTEAELARIDQAATQVPLLLAPNMSVGVNLAFKLIEMAADVLGGSVDMEIIEAHHAKKVDAPSGTAVRMGEILAERTGRTLAEHAVYGRQGHVGERAADTIGFATVRAGDIVGEHTVLFAGAGERIEITHRASSRANFALGAVRAARWLVGQPPGRYDMQDVLGL